MSYFEKATTPSQYDEGEVNWEHEGRRLNPSRRLFLEVLTPYLKRLPSGADTLDVGCGYGWLCQEASELGANAFGFDPSAKNIEAAKQLAPDGQFTQATIDDFQPLQLYNLITAVMVFEHVANPVAALRRIAEWLKPGGTVAIISGEYEFFTRNRLGYKVQTQVINDQEAAARTDYGEKAGVLYDVFRRPEVTSRALALAGLTDIEHKPIKLPSWFMEEQPKYQAHKDETIFDLYTAVAEY